MQTEISDSFKCPVCLDTCIDPVESSCCRNIFCKSCADQLTKCAYCRLECSFQSSIVVKRIIDRMPIECEYCNEKTTRGDLKLHHTLCDNFPIQCCLKNCSSTEKVLKKNYTEHLIQEHKENIQDNLYSIVDVLSGTTKIQEKIDQACSTITSENYQSFISIDTKVNSKGDACRLGKTGKYYCGKRINEQSCDCCNGFCGPTSGCNCTSCMAVDIKSRNLPSGWLVNKLGFSARKSDNGRFYCGRFALKNHPNCDGYCGPNNGPNCDACKLLDSPVFRLRYRQLMS